MSSVNPALRPAGHSVSGKPRIAVIGSGISGASCAWALRDKADVTLFEADDRPGGHTATRDIWIGGRSVSVDTGFIVFNTLTYPLFTALLNHLDVATEESEMSFSLSLDDGRLEWAGSDDWRQAIAQKRNVLRPRFWSMLWGMKRFNELSAADRNSSSLANLTLGGWLDRHDFSAAFRDNYLIPMSAAIWSTPRDEMLDFPADAFLSFFHNHRLNTMDRPKWRTVSGGARNYLDCLLGPLLGEGKVLLGAKVLSVRPSDNGPIVKTARIEKQFDHVILASHSDQSLAMLGTDSSEARRAILSSIAYRPNRVILHSDPSFMPKRRRAWAAWNYRRSSNDECREDVTVTYWMNRLQNIDPAIPLFVTLNPDREPDASRVYGEWTYDHPQFNAGGMAAQKRLDAIQGQEGIWLAGAWTGYGFHEDGLRSGLRVASALGADLPFPAQLQPFAVAGGNDDNPQATTVPREAAE
ncbi:NAD(P)/FAD-dependent oxidoreductase [Notoacmeibacter sp. MSK16QG-6]|uniref:NAD(P)/FAD-dependent oxidoreductase n=1 Tax=Notoacmeibacter sp. MSK16QG-6 TaxID=2957982 RepID=UPI00209E4F78|nr:FAD-dependent oxidoreductase [Notoacmeibacter sp. MSK16QG-6]MCP1199407.1 FAD-dependent oxidoreductase [Notoacmeibacter sp. MSK16QG-6]